MWFFKYPNSCNKISMFPDWKLQKLTLCIGSKSSLKTNRTTIGFRVISSKIGGHLLVSLCRYIQTIAPTEQWAIILRTLDSFQKDTLITWNYSDSSVSISSVLVFNNRFLMFPGIQIRDGYADQIFMFSSEDPAKLVSRILILFRTFIKEETIWIELT